MRSTPFLSGCLLLIAGAVAGSTAAGCFHIDLECRAFYDCNGAGGGAGGSGGTGGTGGAPPECIPNQTSDPIGPLCGVFASASADPAKADGTKDHPFATLGEAIAEAKGQRIYACADDTKPFDEALAITGDVTIYGGVDCSTWTYTPNAKSKWTAGADELPLHAASGASVALTDMAIEAADATKGGGSSIAVLAEANATVDLVRCDVAAGNGKAGETPEAPAGSGMEGMAGGTGLDGCVDTMGKLGADGGQLTCGAQAVSGGSGGQGTKVDAGGDGSKGNPNDAVTGLGGSGQKEAPAAACTPGGDGAEGLAGEPGLGAKGKGSLSSTGFQGTPGDDGGSPGQPGHGAGGGGGAKRCTNMTLAGPSAGGGGSGGCGGAFGKGGKGGKAGGSSIAIASAGATILLAEVTITAKAGGKGGDGGAGQPGGDGGPGGMPGAGDASAIACAGGKGGKGGPGGRGGGGLGGHSIGIAHTGDAPDLKGVKNITVSATQAAGGLGDGAAGNGDQGIAQTVEGF